jgi:hypothetical protein
MACIFEVKPFDGGWCVKICDTGEVLFFSTGGEAERQARQLAAAHRSSARVRIHDRQGRLVGHAPSDDSALSIVAMTPSFSQPARPS